MGFRFQKRIKILPGVTVNLGKRGISTSFGVRGARVNIGRKGVRSTLGIPGTGISYTKYESYKNKNPAAEKLYLTECPSCGHHLRKYWDCCPACHAPLAPYYKEEAAPSPDTVVCPRCGGTIRASGTVNFCPLCGCPLAKGQLAGGNPPLPAPPGEESHRGFWAFLSFIIVFVVIALAL